MKSYLASDMKLMNRKSVYDYISSQEVKYFSRSEIGKISSISNPTILKIINCFIEKEIIFETGEADTVAVGRKPHMLQFNPNSAFAIGAGYDGKYLDIGLINLNFDLVDQMRIRVHEPISSILENVLPGQIQEILHSQYVKKGKLLGLGIALPAMIDEESYRIIGSAPLVGISKPTDLAPFIRNFEARLSLPVFIVNDVNAAAIGEYRSGTNLYGKDMVLITLGSGFGAGIILDGELHRGETNTAGEIGYMVYAEGYITKPNTLGYLENMLNPSYYAEAFGYDAYNDLPECSHTPELIEHIAGKISLTIANLSTSIGISHFVLGGFVVEQLGAPLMEAVHRLCRQYCLLKVNIHLQHNMKASSIGAGSIVIGKTILDFLND